MGQDADYPFDTSAMTEVLFDDIRNISIFNGIFRCTLYSYRIVPSFREPCWVPVLPVALPVSSVAPVAAKALAMVGSGAIKTVKDLVGEQMGFAVH